MTKQCFFCHMQSAGIDDLIARSDRFFSRYDGFPVNKGHALIIPKKHIISFCDLTQVELVDFHDVLLATRKTIDRKFHPKGYNIGINEGAAAGQTIMHLHVHLIPRYEGDVADPIGGVRNVIPGMGNYHLLGKKK